MTKKIIFSALICLSLFLVACGNKKVSETKEDMLEDYISYATDNSLPTKDINAVELNGDKLTFEFTYNGQFGQYIQSLRDANSVDKRLKKYFEEKKVKTVDLKSDVGSMLLSSQYGVDFK